MSAIPRPIFARLWSAYTTALRERPLRTKMIQGGVLFISADSVAQLGIEGKSLRGALMGQKGEDIYDPLRTARLTTYGSLVFAPLAHLWLTRLERVKLSSTILTLGVKVGLDCVIWSPFVTFMFPTSLGLLEGKSIEEVHRKVAMGWFPTWQKAICVFGPTQILNFTFVPVQHRLLTVQSVGLCWNIFLSWQNNKNNKALTVANAHLAEARLHVTEVEVGELRGEREESDLEDAEREVEEAEEAVRRAEEKKEKTRKEGGEVGVGVRMGWS